MGRARGLYTSPTGQTASYVCVCTVGVCVCRCGHTPLKQTHLISLVPRVSQRRRRVERSSRSFGEVWFCESDVDVLITSLRFPRRLRPPRLLPRRSPSVPPSPGRTNEKRRAAREERERGRTASHINIARQPSNQPKKGGVMKMCVFVCESARRCVCTQVCGKKNRFACLIERHFSRL